MRKEDEIDNYQLRKPHVNSLGYRSNYLAS